jgi:hypothetical protein
VAFFAALEYVTVELPLLQLALLDEVILLCSQLQLLAVTSDLLRDAYFVLELFLQ